MKALLTATTAGFLLLSCGIAEQQHSELDQSRSSGFINDPRWVQIKSFKIEKYGEDFHAHLDPKDFEYGDGVFVCKLTADHKAKKTLDPKTIRITSYRNPNYNPSAILSSYKPANLPIGLDCPLGAEVLTETPNTLKFNSAVKKAKADQWKVTDEFYQAWEPTHNRSVTIYNPADRTTAGKCNINDSHKVKRYKENKYIVDSKAWLGTIFGNNLCKTGTVFLEGKVAKKAKTVPTNKKCTLTIPNSSSLAPLMTTIKFNNVLGTSTLKGTADFYQGRNKIGGTHAVQKVTVALDQVFCTKFVLGGKNWQVCINESRPGTFNMVPHFWLSGTGRSPQDGLWHPVGNNLKCRTIH